MNSIELKCKSKSYLKSRRALMITSKHMSFDIFSIIKVFLTIKQCFGCDNIGVLFVLISI